MKLAVLLSVIAAVVSTGMVQSASTADSCVQDCTRELEQLCASDGKTYNNECLFLNAKCRNGTLSVVDATGPCPKQ